MLYLAEVQKPKASFLGGGKAELKLLACQRSDQSWTAERGDELIPAEEANSFNDGALVIVNVVNRSIKGEVEPAGSRLPKILQNFSRLLEKSKNQEEEIEQWKQSLTFQSQEMNRREMEMEQRLEEIRAQEEELTQLEQQRQELEKVGEETANLKQEFERKSQEIEGAWEQLRGEQRRFEELQAEVNYSTGLDQEQATAIQELLDSLSSAVAPTEAVREQITSGFEMVNAQQLVLEEHWQKLEQQQTEATQLEAEVDRQSQELQNRKQEWQQLQTALEQAKTDWRVQQNVLETKQSSAEMLSLQLQTQESLYQELARLATTSADVKISQEVDIDALEKMPLGELEETIKNLQQDWEKDVRFVNDQEEELTSQNQTIEEIQDKINSASEYDRIRLEAELAEEQDCYQMLDRTLVGQRRKLREREEIFNQHQRVLRRRQGIIENSGSDSQKIDLGPILSDLEAQKQQQQEELQKLESQIEQMQLGISEAQEMMQHQANEQETKLAELKNLEESWLSNRVSVAQLWSKVNLYQEILQSTQDGIHEMRQKLETIADALNQIQEVGDYQLQMLAQMRQTVSGLMQSPELATS